MSSIGQTLGVTDDTSLQRDSGKSSLIKTIFKVDMSVCIQVIFALLHCQLMRLANSKGSPINISGRTAEFRPPDNRHLIVHECSAFGPGEMRSIRDFIIARHDESCPPSERLHAIW